MKALRDTIALSILGVMCFVVTFMGNAIVLVLCLMSLDLSYVETVGKFSEPYLPILT